MFMQNEKSFAAAEKIMLSALTMPATPDGSGAGLVAGSLIETAEGWRPVERASRGLRVFTWDGGLARVAEVSRRYVAQASPDAPGLVHVPGGALDNCASVRLLPDQHVLIDSEIAAEVLGESAALVPAAALVGYRGIGWDRPVGTTEIVTLHFADEEVLYVNSGLLLHCAGGAETAYFNRLDLDRARAMLDLMEAGATTSADLGAVPERRLAG